VNNNVLEKTKIVPPSYSYNMLLYLLLLFAFVPPVIYLVWIRNTEKYEREPWIPLLAAFGWGASIAIIASIIIELGFSITLVGMINEYNLLALVLGVVVAPLAEEFTKPLALSLKIVKGHIDELEDGLVYGAIAGLGFSATENLLYGIKFANQGLIVLVALFYTRTIGCCLLHASATALTGYGYSRKLLQDKSLLNIIPFFLLATLLHATYNLFAFSSQITQQTGGVILAIVFAVAVAYWIKRKIRVIDNESSREN